MFIAIYVILSTVNANTEVSEWAYLTIGIAALIEFSLYAFIILKKVKGN